MPSPRVQILVCENLRGPEASKPSCGPEGSDLYRRFKDEIRGAGLRDTVIVTRTGCLKHCSHGIVVGVWPDNVWYRRVSMDDVDDILAAAADPDAGPVERLLLPEDAPWE